MTAGSYYFVNGFHGNGQRGTRNKIIKNVQKPAFELRQQPEAAPSPKSTRQPYTMAIGHTYWVPQGRSIRNSNRRNSCLMLILYFIFIMLKFKKKKNSNATKLDGGDDSTMRWVCEQSIFHVVVWMVHVSYFHSHYFMRRHTELVQTFLWESSLPPIHKYITVPMQSCRHCRQGTCFIYTANDDVVALSIYIFLFFSVGSSILIR